LLTRILEASPREMRPAARFQPRRLGLLGAITPPLGGALALRPVAVVMLAICIGLGAGALAPQLIQRAPTDVDMLTLMWGSPSFNQDGEES
jgi:hypothetical protein